MTDQHVRFMRLALAEAEVGRAEGNLAVGSVIVRGDEVLVRGRNEGNTARDLTAHAETVAIRKLSARLGLENPTFDRTYRPLVGCVLYTTIEPCPMCLWAICLSGISTLVIGARLADFGSVGYGEYTVERLLAMTNVPLTVVAGILAEESFRLRASQSPAAGSRRRE
jgi:tRNA(adenine34) deaminase